MGVVAPGCSDSGGRRTSRGRGRRAWTGEAAGARDVGAATDKWGATTRGLVCSSWVQEGKAARRDADTRARQHNAGRHEFKWDSNNFKRIQICLKLWPIQKVPSILKKFQIKYGWKELEIRNNYPYINFFIFEMEFELKFRELLWVEIHWKILGLWILMKFGKQSPWYTLLPGKSISIKRESEIWIPLKKRIRIDFMIVWILNFIFKIHLLI
jgi:hypothetical protein